MTYLEIVQEVCRLAGITDTGGPTTVVGQTGDFRKAIGYVAISHEEIQSMYFDWDFLWGNSTITTSASVSSYAGESDLGIWDAGRVFYSNADLGVYQWHDYTPETRTNAAPEFAVIRPDNRLLIVPTPDDAYTITYDYYKVPKVLSANADEPYIPARFQRAIVGRAVMLYALHESAQESLALGSEMYGQYMEALQKHQLSRRQQTHGRFESGGITVVAE